MQCRTVKLVIYIYTCFFAHDLIAVNGQCFVGLMQALEQVKFSSVREARRCDMSFSRVTGTCLTGFRPLELVQGTGFVLFCCFRIGSDCIVCFQAMKRHWRRGLGRQSQSLFTYKVQGFKGNDFAKQKDHNAIRTSDNMLVYTYPLRLYYYL